MRVDEDLSLIGEGRMINLSFEESFLYKGLGFGCSALREMILFGGLPLRGGLFA